MSELIPIQLLMVGEKKDCEKITIRKFQMEIQPKFNSCKQKEASQKQRSCMAYDTFVSVRQALWFHLLQLYNNM